MDRHMRFTSHTEKRLEQQASCVHAPLAVTFLINNIILKNIIARTRPYEVVEGLNRIIGAQSDFISTPSRSGVGAPGRDFLLRL